MNNYEYIKGYMKENCMHFGFTLNKNTDADVVEYLETLENKRGYMLDLIRADMKKRQKKGEVSVKAVPHRKERTEKKAAAKKTTAKKASATKATANKASGKKVSVKKAAVKKPAAKKAAVKKTVAKKNTGKKK
ncbi:hypothetical protein SAMN02910370_02740 [Lachnospiraceae bacterium XPB1003]|nr:hypothetical protein SAMN02910370_02740 [Lachnospiraceae bacterium XPB1003]